MFTAILAVSAGFLLGNKEMRVKTDKLLRRTIGGAIDFVNNKRAVKSNEVTDRKISETRSTNGDTTSTNSLQSL